MKLLLVLFFSLTIVSAYGACPDGFEHNGRGCYKAVLQQKSWHNAQRYCHLNYGAHLVSVETKAENDYLMDFIKERKDQLFGYDIWLGANDNNQEKRWRWVVTDNRPVVYSNWSPGQPDGSYEGLERCLEFEVSYNLMWNDDECEDHNMFICERPYNPPQPPVFTGR